jgi:hypothetical protein
MGGKLGLQSQEPLLITGFHELMDEAGRRRKADGEAALTGGEAERQRDMGLAGTGVAERDDVLYAGRAIS